MTPSFLYVCAAILVISAIVYVMLKAPFIPDDYKPFIKWLGLVLIVLTVLRAFGLISFPLPR